VLRREATLTDPWLLSAEIAAATVAGHSSRHIKRGRALLAAGHHSPRHLTELASALATVEMNDGNLPRARKLFRASLQAPNDNSVAQAGWAGRRDSGLGIGDEGLDIPRSFEARAWHDFMRDDWTSAVNNCREWLEDEPFSKRPAIVGSHIALVSLADYKAAEELLTAALRANRGDSGLLNNLAVALVDQGRLEEARSVFGRIRVSDLDPGWQVAVKATEGLLAFRAGDVVAGRMAYLDALEMASQRRLPHVRLAALAYHAREEILAGSDIAEQALQQVERIAERDGFPPGLEPFVRRLRQLFNERRRLDQARTER
jgi:tetratricopeptide (TPR) repeat protein